MIKDGIGHGKTLIVSGITDASPEFVEIPTQKSLYGKSDEDVLELACQLRARVCTLDCTRELHEWSFVVLREVQRRLGLVDKLLDHCDKESGECSVCSRIVCPLGDELHFHHDGCPSCWIAEKASEAGSVGRGNEEQREPPLTTNSLQ